MKWYLAPGMACLAVFVAGCDPIPPRAVVEEAPEPSLDLPESDVSFTWKGTAVDEQYGGLQTRVAIDSSGHPTVAYFAPAYEELPSLPETPEVPEAPEQRSVSGSPFLETLPGPLSSMLAVRRSAAAALELPEDLPWSGEGSPFQDYVDEFVPPTFYHLRYARWDGAYWSVEDVADVSHARGLSLLQTRNGYPIIAYLDSDHDVGPEWCSATFLRLAIRTSSGWQMTTAVEPREVVDGLCTPGEDCPVCEVTGLGPVLAEGPAGTVGLAFRRTRFAEGTLGDPDSDLAFVALAIEGTTLTPGPVQIVHQGEGSGFFTAMQYATDDQGWQVPHLAYISFGEFDTGGAVGAWFARFDKTRSEWVAREIDPWENWIAGAPLQMIIDAQDIYLLMYAIRAEHTSVLLDLVLLHSRDAGEDWDREYIVSTGRSGGYPSMAMDLEGRLAVSFYQCGGAFDATCEPENDGLMFALRESTGWNIDAVHHDGAQLDGMFTALAFTGDTPVIASRSANWRGPQGGQALEVYFGSPVD